MTTATITIPCGRTSAVYDRDLLTTAILVVMDVRGDDVFPSLPAIREVSARLRDEHGMTARDAHAYAVAAQQCRVQGIEP